jgi:NAD(P)H-hydrate epimerase
MNIVTGETMAAIDRVSIQERNIPSLHLMERAGRAVARECHRLCGDPTTPVLALCGKGNNGGDGFVAARYLQGYGYRPKVLLSHPPEELSEDGQTNWKRFDSSPIRAWGVWKSEETESWFEGRPVVIDALLGTGVQGAPRPPFDELIELSNDKSCWALGVDIPSGVNSDTGKAPGAAIRCRATVTFGLPKTGHFLREGLDLTGSLSIANIGFAEDLLEKADSQAFLLTPEWASRALPRYPISTHKGARGRALIVAGSPNLMGAGLLCAKAALATGSGLVTLALPESLNGAAKATVPEVMTLPLAQTTDGAISTKGLETALRFAESVDALAVGPGLGRDPETELFVHEFLERSGAPLVLDADGINSFQRKTHGELLVKRREPTVMTPHPGELARFLGVSVGDIESDRWGVSTSLVEDLNVTLVLKGAATVIASPDRKLLLNRSGHPAMAQGGMGDALTGAIVSFLGQGLDPHTAAALGVYLHGRAGEYAARSGTAYSISASQLISHISEALNELLAFSTSRQWASSPKSIRKEKGT